MNKEIIQDDQEYLIKVLLVSVSCWKNDNCYGSTYSAVFGGMDDIKIAHVYRDYGLPDADVPVNVKRFFQINEKMLIKNLLSKKYPVGVEVYRCGHEKSEKTKVNDFTCTEQSVIHFLRRHHWRWIKYLNWFTTWSVGRWRSKELIDFVNDFNPDVIWVDVAHEPYANKIALYIKKMTGLPMTAFISDEHYSMAQLRLSPIYWIVHLLVRPAIKRVFTQCPWFYVISDGQKKVYEKIFKKECKILTKSNDFDGNAPELGSINKPLKLIYMGNLNCNRWKTLVMIGKALKKINSRQTVAELDVYSSQPVSSKIKKAFDVSGSINFKGSVAGSAVASILLTADILVCAESFDFVYSVGSRHAFSTKIVDYLHSGKCIMAVGPQRMNSINYFTKNDAGLVATSSGEIEECLSKIINNPELLAEYGRKAWECGKKYHQRNKIQKALFNDLNELKNVKG